MKQFENKDACLKKYKSYQSFSKRQKISFNLSFEEFLVVIKGFCFYCGESYQTHSAFNELVRLNDFGDYTPQNCVAICETCLLAKNSMSSDQFKAWINKMINYQFPLSLGFEDIAIKQKKNLCETRLISTKSEIIKGVTVSIPMIASNMSTVINSDFYIQLQKFGAFGFMHRALPNDGYIEEVKKIAKQCQWVAVSIGIGDSQYFLAKELIKNGANIIVIDIAHGYSDPVIHLGRKIKKEFPHVKLVIGNTVNTQLMYEIADFADAVKVGIAQGFACETKNTAGCTEKQFSAVLKFKEISKQLGLPVISDGGIREPADFTKSIAAGANSIMAGKIFAACPESAAEIVEVNNKKVKLYAGMASRHVQNEWKGGLKKGTCPEGGVRYLDIGESLELLLERYQGALRTGITYAGGKDLVSFQNCVEFIRFK